MQQAQWVTYTILGGVQSTLAGHSMQMRMRHAMLTGQLKNAPPGMLHLACLHRLDEHAMNFTSTAGL